jgi:hypothetical protein
MLDGKDSGERTWFSAWKYFAGNEIKQSKIRENIHVLISTDKNQSINWIITAQFKIKTNE